MAYYTDRPQAREINGRTYRIRLEVDEIPDTSWMGEYTDRPPDVTFCVWRTDGTLRGAKPPEPEEPEDSAGLPDDEHDAVWDAYDEAMIAWDESGPEILKDYLPRAGWHEYKFFVPYAGGLDPYDPQTDRAEWAKYAEQDYRRMEDLNRGGWCFVGVIVETQAPTCGCCGHTETLGASLWGIESDAGDSYFDSVVEDLIGELDAELAKYAAHAAA